MKAIISKETELNAMGVVGIGETEDLARADTARATYSGKPMPGGQCVDVSERYATAVLFVRGQGSAQEASEGREQTRIALGYVTLRDGVLDFADDAFDRARAYFSQEA